MNMTEQQLYALGDSHSIVWSGMAPSDRIYLINGIGTVINTPSNDRMRARVFHLGPCLAYNMINSDSTTRGREKVEYLISYGFLPKGARVITCFGEIDIRSQILKSGRKDSCKRLDTAVYNYLKFIKQLSLSGFKVTVWGPIATQKDDWSVNKMFPRYGTEEERNVITDIFNKKLQECCSELNATFLTFFYDMIDANMHTKDGYIFDECHLHSKYHPEIVKRLTASI